MSIQQKITWEIYKSELDTICTGTRNMRLALLKRAKHARILSIIFGYPVKLIIGITVGGGITQLLDKNAVCTVVDGQIEYLSADNNWITIVSTVLSIIALILSITRDFFEFEKKIEQYYTAAAALDLFYKSVKYESFLKQGSEKDRFETLVMFQKLYSEMVATNKVIQTVESISTPSTPLEPRSAQTMDMHSVSSDEEEPVISHGSREDQHRMFYMREMLERMPK